MKTERLHSGHPTGRHRLHPQYITKQTYTTIAQVGTPEGKAEPSKSREKRRTDHADTWDSPPEVTRESKERDSETVKP